MSAVPKWEPLTDQPPTAMRWTWVLTAHQPAGDPVAVAQWVDKTLQAEGDFGAAAVHGEVSNSGKGYAPVVRVAYPDVVGLPWGVAWFRPVLEGPSATSAVVVSLVGRKA